MCSVDLCVLLASNARVQWIASHVCEFPPVDAGEIATVKRRVELQLAATDRPCGQTRVGQVPEARLQYVISINHWKFKSRS